MEAHDQNISTDIAVVKTEMSFIRRTMDEIRADIKAMSNFFATKDELKNLDGKTAKAILVQSDEISKLDKKIDTKYSTPARLILNSVSIVIGIIIAAIMNLIIKQQ